MEATPNRRNLAARRQLLGPYSLRALAQRAGISPSYFSRVLAGKRRPLMETVSKLARARGMEIGEFFGLLTTPDRVAKLTRNTARRTRRVVRRQKKGAR